MAPRKLTYFLSDFHLGARYLDNPLDNERRVVAFLDSIKNDAKEIFLLGDILDYWYEYRYVVPRGFTRFFGKIAELTDMGVKVHWFLGNHDIWIFDYLPTELGVDVVYGPMVCNIDGKKFFLDHGDGVGKRKLSFRVLRSIFRNKVCQKLYAAIHPRWTIPFALGWSHGSRANDSFPHYMGEGNEYLEEFAKEYSQTHKIDYFVFGHRHIMLSKEIGNNSHLIMLGDWLHFCSYAVFDGTEMHLKTFEMPIKSIMV